MKKKDVVVHVESEAIKDMLKWSARAATECILNYGFRLRECTGHSIVISISDVLFEFNHSPISFGQRRESHIQFTKQQLKQIEERLRPLIDIHLARTIEEYKTLIDKSDDYLKQREDESR